MKNQDLIDTAQEATIRFGAATLERFTDEEQRTRAASAMHSFGDRATGSAHDLGSRASEAAHDLGDRLSDRLGEHSTSDVADSLADAATTAAKIWASPRGRKVAIGAGLGLAGAAGLTWYRRRKAARDAAFVDDLDLPESPHGVAGWDTPAEAFAGLDTTDS